MSNADDLRSLVNQDEFETGFGVREVEDVNEGRIFGLTAGERMIISVILFMAAAGAPTPLYIVYQQRWGFPTSTLTLVFAVYVLGLLATVLVVGGLSDHVGRRPVIISAGVGMSVFPVRFGVPPEVVEITLTKA